MLTCKQENNEYQNIVCEQSHLKGNKFSKVVISKHKSGKISYTLQNYKILELYLFNYFNSFDRRS